MIQTGARAVDQAMLAPLLLVFADEPENDVPSRNNSLDAALGVVRRSCLPHIVAIGNQAGCRVVVASPQAVTLPGVVGWIPQPIQGSFASRLEACLVAASAWQGDAGVTLVVPADIPELRVADLELATRSLEHDPAAVVVGPSPDGGLYLIGWSGTAPRLDGVPWCTRSTRRAVLASLRANKRSVVVLAPRRDVDHPGDLAHLRASMRGSCVALPGGLEQAIAWALACLRDALRLPEWSVAELVLVPAYARPGVRGPPHVSS